MAIVGKFLKKTTSIGYNLGVKTKKLNIEQRSVLTNLLLKAKKTKFGKDYAFADILKQEFLGEAFRATVPLFSYESFFDPYIKDLIADKKNISWPGKIHYFALSSGTTTDTSKRIPVSDQMLRQFQKTTLQQLLYLHELNLPEKFFQASVLTIGGSTKLTMINDHFEGDLSGILQKKKALVYRSISKPGKRIACIKDWNEKLEEIVENAPKWDIGVIAGAPSWILMIIRQIVEEYKLESIHDLWPNFRLFLHGGVYLDTYKKKIEELCGKPIFFQNTYLASEGYFAYQRHPDDEGMTLLTNHGVYYEFIEARHFDAIKKLGDMSNIPTLLLPEIKENENYALVVSTSSGLWRYFMGDVVKFVNLEKLQLQIEGRVKHTLSLVGEHLSVENMNKAIQKTTESLGIFAEEFCVVSAKKEVEHRWYIGSSQMIDEKRFATQLDKNLSALNDDYKYVRKYLLNPPKVKIVPLETFYKFMELKGKLGGQHKFPRVLNNTQACEWETFLS